MDSKSLKYKYLKYKNKYMGLVETDPRLNSNIEGPNQYLLNSEKEELLKLAPNSDCSRCNLKIEGIVMGGRYGIACKGHRYCYKCWFEKDYNYGERKNESESLRKMPLVGKDVEENRWKGNPICYGCALKRPYHTNRYDKIKDMVNTSGTIEEPIVLSQ